MSEPTPSILYCRCAFARVVPDEAKAKVLEGLCDSGVEFECVADLCEMAARRDERLEGISKNGSSQKIVACFPRAVKWLFHQAEVPLPEDVEVLNMRESDPDEILKELLEE